MSTACNIASGTARGLASSHHFHGTLVVSVESSIAWGPAVAANTEHDLARPASCHPPMASNQHSASGPNSNRNSNSPLKRASVPEQTIGTVTSLATACQAQERLQVSSGTTAIIAAPSGTASIIGATTDATTPGKLAQPQPPVNSMAWVELAALASYSQTARLADDMRVQQKLANNSLLIQQLLQTIASNSSSCGTDLLDASVAATILSDIVYDNKTAAMLLSVHDGLAAALSAGLAGGVNYESYFANTAEIDTVKADYLSPESCSIINYSLKAVIRDKHTLLISCAAVACAVAAACPDTVKLAMVQESGLMAAISKVLSQSGPLSTKHGGFWLQPWNMVPTRLQQLRAVLAQTVRHILNSEAAAQNLCRQHPELVIFAERFSSMEIPYGVEVSSLAGAHPAVTAAAAAASQHNPAGTACQVSPALSASDRPPAASSTSDGSQSQQASSVDSNGSNRQQPQAMQVKTAASIFAVMLPRTPGCPPLLTADITHGKKVHPQSTAGAMAMVRDSNDRLCCFAAADPIAAIVAGIRYINDSNAMSELLRHLQRGARDTADGAQLLMACSQLLSHVLQPCFVPNSRNRVPRPLQREKEIQLQVPRLSFVHVQVIAGLLQGIAAHWSAATSGADGTNAGPGPALKAVMQALCDVASLPLFSRYKPSRLANFDEYPIVVLKARIDRLSQTKRSNMDATDRKHIDCHRSAVEEAAQQQQTLEDLMLAIETVQLLAAKSGDGYAIRVMYLLVSVMRKLQKCCGAEGDGAVVKRFDNAVQSYRPLQWQDKVLRLLQVFP